MTKSVFLVVPLFFLLAQLIFAQDSNEAVTNEEPAPEQTAPSETSPTVSEAQPVEENSIPEGKVVARYKFGKIQKEKLLKQQKANMIRQGYRGQQLANRLRGAEMGIEMGLSTMGLNLELRDNGYYYTVKDGEPTSPKKYRIVGNVFQIEDKSTGKFKAFGKFAAGRKILAIINSDAVLEKY